VVGEGHFHRRVQKSRKPTKASSSSAARVTSIPDNHPRNWIPLPCSEAALHLGSLLADETFDGGSVNFLESELGAVRFLYPVPLLGHRLGPEVDLDVK